MRFKLTGFAMTPLLIFLFPLRTSDGPSPDSVGDTPVAEPVSTRWPVLPSRGSVREVPNLFHPL